MVKKLKWTSQKTFALCKSYSSQYSLKKPKKCCLTNYCLCSELGFKKNIIVFYVFFVHSNERYDFLHYNFYFSRSETFSNKKTTECGFSHKNVRISALWVVSWMIKNVVGRLLILSLGFSAQFHFFQTFLWLFLFNSIMLYK